MSKKIRPLSLTDFPEISTNCFGFAIGNTDSVKASQTIYNLREDYPISLAFVEKLKELGYENLPHQIASLDEAKENEYVFMVFDFTSFKVRNPFVGWTEYKTYHVVRRNLDGTWVHKPGWHEPPCEIHDEDWHKIFNEFGKNYVLFALET